MHFTPAGVPISMVHVTAPDLDRYPRFAEALEAAQVAELGPGDALFIPYAWYHHVESLEPFNMWVNYWWNEARDDLGSAWDAMLHGMLSLRPLPPHQRAAWRAMFDHYVFQLGGDPAEHLSTDLKGVLGPVTPEAITGMRQALIEALTKDQERR
jgi:cupin-like protein